MTQSPPQSRRGASGSSPFAPRLLWQNAYFTVLLDEPARLVRHVRSDKPFTSIAEIEAAFEELFGALDGIDRSFYALLVDIRAAPGRNDPQFEATMARIRARWFAGFRKVGVLVQSAVGALQVQRYAKRDGVERLISSDEAELLRHLAHGR